MIRIHRSVIAVAVARVSSLAAQQPGARSTFITTKGKDTVAIETVTRDGLTLTSDVAQMNGPRTQYTLNLKPDSSVQRVELTRQNRQGGGVSLFVGFGDTLVTASMSSAGESNNFEFPTHGRAIPFLAASFALSEQIFYASHVGVGKSATWTAVRLGVADTAAMTVTRFHKDSVLIAMPDVQIKLALSPQGVVVGGQNMLQGWLVERKPALRE